MIFLAKFMLIYQLLFSPPSFNLERLVFLTLQKFRAPKTSSQVSLSLSPPPSLIYILNSFKCPPLILFQVFCFNCLTTLPWSKAISTINIGMWAKGPHLRKMSMYIYINFSRNFGIRFFIKKLEKVYVTHKRETLITNGFCNTKLHVYQSLLASWINFLVF